MRRSKADPATTPSDRRARSTQGVEGLGLTTWPADWEERRRGVGCPACADGRPDRIPDGELIFAGATSDAYLSRSSAARGYTLLTWRGRHVSEMDDLRPDELLSFTQEPATVRRAIEAYYRPLKLNPPRSR